MVLPAVLKKKDSLKFLIWSHSYLESLRINIITAALYYWSLVLDVEPGSVCVRLCVCHVMETWEHDINFGTSCKVSCKAVKSKLSMYLS